MHFLQYELFFENYDKIVGVFCKKGVLLTKF